MLRSKLLPFILVTALLAGGCARRPTWTGFHGPAYLPAKPPRPTPGR